MVNKKNPFAFKAKQETKKKSGGKRIGKSKPDKANNQLKDRKSTRLNSSHIEESRMPSSA